MGQGLLLGNMIRKYSLKFTIDPWVFNKINKRGLNLNYAEVTLPSTVLNTKVYKT